MRDDDPPWVETCSVLWKTYIVCYNENIFVESIIIVIIYLTKHNKLSAIKITSRQLWDDC
jgi:hypothetical protein